MNWSQHYRAPKGTWGKNKVHGGKKKKIQLHGGKKKSGTWGKKLQGHGRKKEFKDMGKIVHCVNVLPGYFCFKNKDDRVYMPVIILIFIPPCPFASA